MSSWPVATESIKAHAEPAWQIGVLCVLLLLAAAAHAAPVMVVQSSGYTSLTPPEGAQVIYVSSSTGDDENDGLTPETAIQSIAEANSRQRNSTEWTEQPGFISYPASDPPDVTWYSDWFLLRCGDTWDETISPRNGKSPTEPVVWASYGDGARPIVSGDINKGSNTAYVVSNLYFIGIQMGKVIINNAQWEAAGWAKSSNIRFEDTLTQSLSFQYVDDLRFYRSIIADAYNTTTHSQGSYLNDCDGVVIDECLYDHNGWRDEDPYIQGGAMNEDRTYAFAVTCSSTTVTVERTDPVTGEVAEFSLSSSKVYTGSSELIVDAASGTWIVDDIALGDVSDDFADGDYTASPTWTVNSGTWSAAGNALTNTSAGDIAVAQSSGDYSGSFTCNMDSDGTCYVYLRYTDASNYVRLAMDADQMILLSKKTGQGDVTASCFPPWPTVFNHNVYIKENCSGTVFRNTITARASATGCQMRGGGTAQNNLFLENPLALDWGLVNGSPITVGGVTGTVIDNVVLGDDDICPRAERDCDSLPRGRGFAFGNVASGTVSGNIICNVITAELNNTAMQFDADLSDNSIDNIGEAGNIGINNLAVSNNIIAEWQTLELTDGTYSGLSLTDNVISNGTVGNFCVIIEDSDDLSGIAFSGNTYYTSGSYVAQIDSGNASYASMISATGESGSSNSEPSYPDEARDIASYMATLGFSAGDQTTEKFLEVAREQRRATWNPAFTADAVNDYIREGFDR